MSRRIQFTYDFYHCDIKSKFYILEELMDEHYSLLGTVIMAVYHSNHHLQVPSLRQSLLLLRYVEMLLVLNEFLHSCSTVEIKFYLLSENSHVMLNQWLVETGESYKLKGTVFCFHKD